MQFGTWTDEITDFKTVLSITVSQAAVSLEVTRTMNDWTKCDAVERHLDKLSGAWVFKGTRVPVSALFENLRDGASVDEFLEWFPGVGRDQVNAVLNQEIATAEAAKP